MKTLTCGCCGKRAKGKQWFNQDTGYGLCHECVPLLLQKEGAEQLMRSYGRPGKHFAAQLDQDVKPGTLVYWKNVDGSWHIGVFKEWDNGTAIISEITELDERKEVAV